MKKYILFTAGLIILLFNSRGIAQHRLPTATDITRFTHDMAADSADSWEYSGGSFFDAEFAKYAPKFDVWAKVRSADRFKRYLNLSLRGTTLYSQLFNAAEFELSTTSIPPAIANKYQYRVVANGNIELVPWTTPSVFRKNKFTDYTWLGKFDGKYKTITLLIAEKNHKNNKSVYVYSNEEIPQVKITGMMVQYENGLSGKDASDWNKGFGILLAKNVQSINIKIENTAKNELYHVYIKRDMGQISSIYPVGNSWEHSLHSTDPEMHISSSYFNKPGKYTIIIRPQLIAGYGESTIGAEATAHFTTFPAPITVSLKTVAYIILILLTTGGFMFMMYRRQQKRKLAREAQNKQIAMLQLQGVRAQLNPHFIFNALAGIQNLINKNAIEDANKYLTRFARLTRNVLDEGHKDLITIEQEISLLDDYLQMEQTRFGFMFNITAAADVDKQIEIPAMLIQPFAENAVKHGISALKEKGMVTVNIGTTNTDVTLTVHDNGKGFAKPDGTGKGIKLCEERIALLNSIYKKSAILLRIETGDEGTSITINLKNWL
jgi:two-component system LytT family sensor kinase